MKDLKELQKTYNHWVDEILGGGTQTREGKWTEAIAVGSKEFVDATAERLGIRGKGRQVIVENGGYQLREAGIPYNSDFDPENGALSDENTYFWDESSEKST